MKANYTYLSDGTKAAAYTSVSAGKGYVGSFEYDWGANGTRTLESVAFGGKEVQDGAFGIANSDFGARFLAFGTASWTSIDPMAEKYYSVSPYAYCNNNPVNRIDPNGMTDWKTVRQGAYSVVGGVAATIGGSVMAGASAGALAGLSAFLISDGIVAIGTGMTLMTVGFVDDAQLSEEAQNIPMSIPEMGGVISDELSGRSDHLGKNIGSLIDCGVSLFAVGVGGPKPMGSTVIGFMAQAGSLRDTFKDMQINAISENEYISRIVQDINSPYLWDPNQQWMFLYPEE